MNIMPRLMAVLLLLAVAGCESTGAPSTAYVATAGVSQAAPAAPTEDYRIGPLDKLNINVYQMKDLTLNDIQVDNSGKILLPLIGSVTAAGRTAPELSNDIAGMLRGRYLQAPQVAVWVTDAQSQKVTVDGSVNQPGVYALSGPSTLMQALAMAKGPDMKFANLSRVVVFRTINGQRSAAVFNLKLIRQGKEPDPEILGNDIVVVDGSQVKSVWRETITALPGIAIFRPLF
jgi:polysaccharide export outer membrane protein